MICKGFYRFVDLAPILLHRAWALMTSEAYISVFIVGYVFATPIEERTHKKCSKLERSALLPLHPTPLSPTSGARALMVR
jgi:hypothetical protein